MNVREVKIEIINPSEGMWLTENEENVENRTFCKEIINPRPEDWKEVSDAYKAQWEYEHPAPATVTNDFDYPTDGEVDEYIESFKIK